MCCIVLTNVNTIGDEYMEKNMKYLLFGLAGIAVVALMLLFVADVVKAIEEVPIDDTGSGTTMKCGCLKGLDFTVGGGCSKQGWIIKTCEKTQGASPACTGECTTRLAP